MLQFLQWVACVAVAIVIIVIGGQILIFGAMVGTGLLAIGTCVLVIYVVACVIKEYFNT